MSKADPGRAGPRPSWRAQRRAGKARPQLGGRRPEAHQLLGHEGRVLLARDLVGGREEVGHEADHVHVGRRGRLGERGDALQPRAQAAHPVSSFRWTRAREPRLANAFSATLDRFRRPDRPPRPGPRRRRPTRPPRAGPSGGSAPPGRPRSFAASAEAATASDDAPPSSAARRDRDGPVGHSRPAFTTAIRRAGPGRARQDWRRCGGCSEIHARDAERRSPAGGGPPPGRASGRRTRSCRRRATRRARPPGVGGDRHRRRGEGLDPLGPRKAAAMAPVAYHPGAGGCAWAGPVAGVHRHAAVGRGDDRAGALEHGDRERALRQVERGLEARGLDLLSRAAEQARGLAGVRGADRRGGGRRPYRARRAGARARRRRRPPAAPFRRRMPATAAVVASARPRPGPTASAETRVRLLGHPRRPRPG